MNKQRPSIQLGSWEVISSEGGGALALANDRLAVSGQARLVVWRGKARQTSVEARSPAPGVPRLAGELVYWGPGSVDITTGRYEVLSAAQPTLRPGHGERPQVYAWSPGGERLVASFSTGDAASPARVVLFDGGTGTVVAPLLTGGGLAPEAAWLGRQAVVLGLADPRVFDHRGTHLADIELGGGSVVHIEADATERRLIAVDLNRAIAWIDAASWTVLDRWPGPWLHAAVSPDGRFVAALAPGGEAHFACIHADRFGPAARIAVHAQAVVLALSADQMATLGGGEVRWAGLTVECAQAP